MNVEYIGRNVHVSDDVRRQVEQKVQKLMRFLDGPCEARFTLDAEKHGHRLIAELHISHRHGVLLASEETTGEASDALSALFDRIEEQARRSHDKRIDERRRGERTGGSMAPEP